MRAQLLPLLIILVFISNCSSSDSTEEVSNNEFDMDEFHSFQLNESIQQSSWPSLIENIEITRLEETDESLLSYVQQVFTVGDYFVFVSGKERNIYVFNKSGEFVNVINRKGEGPEEYTSIQDLWLEGDTIVVYSRGKYLKYYDFEGEFIDSENIDYQAGHILEYDGGYALDTYFATIDDSLFYNVVTLDNSFERERLLQEYKQPEGFNMSTSNNTLKKYKSTFLYQRMMSDTLYKHTEQGMIPMIHFDFGKDWFWNEEGDVEVNRLDKMFESDKFWTQFAMVSTDYIHVSVVRGKGNPRSFLIDRNKSKVIEFEPSREDEEPINVDLSHFIQGGIMGSIQSLHVAELIGKLDEGQYTFKEGTSLQEIESSENPALVKIKFKDSSEW